MPKIKIDPADRFFALYIKTRDKWRCQRCRKKYELGSRGLHCSHYFGRGNENTRFDDDNCVALCWGCHQYWDSRNREEYRNFKITQLGDDGFKKLTLRAHLYKKKDRKLELIAAKAKYEAELKKQYQRNYAR